MVSFLLAASVLDRLPSAKAAILVEVCIVCLSGLSFHSISSPDKILAIRRHIQLSSFKI